MGATIGDFLTALLDWKKALVALVFVALLATILVGVYGVAIVWVPRTFGVAKSDFKIGSMQSSVLFQSEDDDKTNYLTMVHPQGWQDTDIKVVAGQMLTFRAGGRIQVDVNSLVEQARLRADWEQKLRKPRGPLDPDSTDPVNIPEDRFSPEQREQLRDARVFRPWTGPQGYPSSVRAWKARDVRFVKPQSPLGALLGSIGSDPNAHESVFVIGTGGVHPAERDGTLWVTVNDVTSDASVPELFFRDNVGFFWLKVVVAKK